VRFHVDGELGDVRSGEGGAADRYRGMVDVATIMAGIAGLAGWNFQNDGVTGKLEDVYYPGTAWDQMQAVKEEANIETFLNDGVPKTLIIWPKGGSRGGSIPLVSRHGHDRLSVIHQNGIVVSTKFNPSIGGFGQRIKVVTDLASAKPQRNFGTSLDLPTRSMRRCQTARGRPASRRSRRASSPLRLSRGSHAP